MAAHALKVVIAIVLLLPLSAHAQTCGTISSCPAASTPLNGAEIVPCVQGGLTKKCTVASVAGTMTLPTLTGNSLIGNPTTSSTTASAVPLPNCGGANNALSWIPGSGFSCNNIVSYGAGTGLSVSGGNLNIANTIGAAGPIGDATDIPVLTFNAQGQLTAVTTVTVSASGLTATSLTSVTIGMGAKSFTTQSGKSFGVGQFLVISSSAGSSNYMHGQVTSYSGTSLVMNILDTGGSGTFASWNIAVSGVQGPGGTIGGGTTGQTAYYNSATTITGTSNIAITTNGVQFGGGQILSVRTITASGAVTVTTADSFLCIKKTTGAATAVNLDASPATGETYHIKDCKRDAATNNITITPNSGTIDGASTFVMNQNGQEANVTYTGSEWSVW